MDINFPLEPPVNNLIQPTIYDQVGASTFEKIRVINAQLNTRLSIQERVLNKYKNDAERTHQNQKRRIRREMRKIRKKKPDYSEESNVILGSKGHNSFQRSDAGSRHRSLSEGSDQSYCRRFYSHHFNIKDPTKIDKEAEKKKPEKTDYFNARMRWIYLNMSGRYFNTSLPTYLEHPDQLTEADENLADSVFDLPDDIRNMNLRDCKPK